VSVVCQCYNTEWAGFALYAVAMGLIYVVGLPAGVLWILYRRRHKLFGDSRDPFAESTRIAYGFLYEAYGPGAWWWEVEELVRKLLLSAVVVLIEPGSPLQVCCCCIFRFLQFFFVLLFLFCEFCFLSFSHTPGPFVVASILRLMLILLPCFHWCD
jgi:hypothetical protein